MSVFGWCMEGRHGYCPAVLPATNWPDAVKKGGIYELPARTCPCECHTRNYVQPLLKRDNNA